MSHLIQTSATSQSRRAFFSKMAVAAAAPSLLASRAFSADAPKAVKLTTDDPVAKALGYSEDTTKVDSKKYPQHKPEQRCDGCALYTGKPGDPEGPCTAFQNKIVTAGGWCSAFAAKPPAADTTKKAAETEKK